MNIYGTGALELTDENMESPLVMTVAFFPHTLTEKIKNNTSEKFGFNQLDDGWRPFFQY
ncbi:MAG TPA: hypothetical protein VI461_14495 [Chitinophagaceae bacterium]|nr:hypothetical protein [Chitinophagaceae bacterium]